MKILIVEDDVAQRVALERAFDSHTIRSYGRSSDALKEKDFDVAILDLMIEDDMSGIRLARQLRKNQPDCHVIIYTALTAGKHYMDAMAVADAVIEKQIGIENIKAAIEVAHG